jgi:hypothetical protein
MYFGLFGFVQSAFGLQIEDNLNRRCALLSCCLCFLAQGGHQDPTFGSRVSQPPIHLQLTRSSAEMA